ncbi:hypothetical protein STIUS_v1c03860 [Spiroplasma sp. TIUS-1]|uniref:hypothetical protein n=1 Tax=Spiroplasma sp. TIUS-1 TaxID=216963 RepID=UPI0013972B40|nr:hypothetical protein [Spiroplasma sp. TIUS-1]QHX35940.1 hypothetical protein STIUS_v1c03860 [Spiroplasma sp. TIUS-1]
MRNSVKLVIALLVIAVIYFGYSSWIDTVAIYNINGNELGSTGFNNILREIWELNFENKSAYDYLAKDPELLALMGSLNIIENGGLSEASKANLDFIIALVDFGNKATATEGNDKLTYLFEGFMAPNSLAKKLLDPFKLILVGGVFALFVPLTIKVFLGTVSGIKVYLRGRQANLLFNYEKSIAYATDLQAKIAANDLAAVKASYGAYAGLSFKPKFLDNMMDELIVLIVKEKNVSHLADPAQTVVDGLKTMYSKERQRAITGRGDEMFFDFKRGYEYSSLGSSKVAEYYKAMPDSERTSNLGWKMISLEMIRFGLFLAITFLPAFAIFGVITAALNGVASDLSDSLSVLIVSTIALGTWIISAVVCHYIYIMRKPIYRDMKKEIAKPLRIYYILYFLMFMTLAVSMVGIASVGAITEPGSGTKIWSWFAAIASLVLSSSLILYVIATLIDANKVSDGMSKKALLNGIVIPLIAWVVGVMTTLAIILLNGFVSEENLADYENIIAIVSIINFVTLVVFWIYIALSGFILNNVVYNKKRHVMTKKALADKALEVEIED